MSNVGRPGAGSQSPYTSECPAGSTSPPFSIPAPRRLSATPSAARTMSPLCSDNVLTDGIRRNSVNSSIYRCLFSSTSCRYLLALMAPPVLFWILDLGSGEYCTFKVVGWQPDPSGPAL